ncbi:chorismate mutase [Halalkalibacterium halodurans]|uniref:chorismate mutase n=1 Tax=Halalkalibacterium halodurans TaxID=86665 RepID=A0A0M0KN54_ALKHA|nr:chorismate mutase [Halalkalibacterium halodurans]MED3646088.1 chorismate mutase [Halalkalibacterium halodurans]MED4081365.1 chorismate mutase [Halalkalibacterium halodurans]MED4086904.1 chorismate mutase [Halalkalibacterium halodurans]MED4104321.1 chorismate mutase [Halalkalibacterium halodurans]MED4109216.1 chorismate mutase [Halalkalibacterium halodurans]
MVRGVRGATTVKANQEKEILDATEGLMRTICEENEIDPENVAQVILTVTEDLTATFPAKALRRLAGWTHVPVMCAQEIPVPNGLEKCIRVMITLNTTKAQSEIHHVYLNEAVKLRPDLQLTKDS